MAQRAGSDQRGIGRSCGVRFSFRSHVSDQARLGVAGRTRVGLQTRTFGAGRTLLGHLRPRSTKVALTTSAVSRMERLGMGINWTAFAALATGASAVATSLAAIFTARMAGKTKQSVEQTKELVTAARTQADASKTQADAAEVQVDLARDQVRVTEVAMLAMYTPVLAPSFFGGIEEERGLDPDGIYVTLAGGEGMVFRFRSVDVSGHVQSRVRYDDRHPDVVFTFCFRNVGVGPAVIENARLLISGGRRNLLNTTGFADLNVPIVDRRVMVSFRSGAKGSKLSQGGHMALVEGIDKADCRITVSLNYRSPSSNERRATAVTYRYRSASSTPFDVLGAMLVESFETRDVNSQRAVR
jgi:hypothetical protein